MKSKVSVIIPIYNEEKVIGESLESLCKQSYKNFEIIVVDDGSTNDTVDVVKSIHYSLPTIHLLHQQHLGPGVARNLGAKNATGDILVFVDADMTFDKDFIKKLVQLIKEDKSRGTFSKEEYVANPENVWSRCWGINEGWKEGKRHPVNYPNTQKVFRAILKSEFDRVGGFDEGGYYTDDWSLSEKLGYEATLASNAKFYHKNPETLVEVFQQAKWVAKRKYKLGIFGMLLGLVRASLPVSVLVGGIKALSHTKPHFFAFKLVYDSGAFIGILEYMFFGKGAR